MLKIRYRVYLSVSCNISAGTPCWTRPVGKPRHVRRRVNIAALISEMFVLDLKIHSRKIRDIFSITHMLFIKQHKRSYELEC